MLGGRPNTAQRENDKCACSISLSLTGSFTYQEHGPVYFELALSMVTSVPAASSLPPGLHHLRSLHLAT